MTGFENYRECKICGYPTYLDLCNLCNIKKTTKSIKHASTLISEIIDQKGGTEKFALIRLWKNWEHVLGENLAKLAKPLGTNKKTLIIGVEDSLLMQELTFFYP